MIIVYKVDQKLQIHKMQRTDKIVTTQIVLEFIIYKSLENHLIIRFSSFDIRLWKVKNKKFRYILLISK